MKTETTSADTTVSVGIGAQEQEPLYIMLNKVGPRGIAQPPLATASRETVERVAKTRDGDAGGPEVSSFYTH